MVAARSRIRELEEMLASAQHLVVPPASESSPTPVVFRVTGVSAGADSRQVTQSISGVSAQANSRRVTQDVAGVSANGNSRRRSLQRKTYAESVTGLSAPTPAKTRKLQKSEQPASQSKQPPLVIDAHCHWDKILQPQYYGCVSNTVSGVENHVKDSRSKVKPQVPTNVELMVSVFCDPATWWLFSKISDHRIRPAIGYHPKHCLQSRPDRRELDHMTRVLADKRCVAFGEVGLDFHHAQTSAQRRNQEVAFKNLLDTYVDSGTRKPLVLHLRNSEDPEDPDNAYQVGLRCVREKGCLDAKIHLHYFSGNTQDMARWIKSVPRVVFGLTPQIMQHEKVQGYAEFIRKVPTDKLVAETDAPYCKPPNISGPNHPWHVHQVLDFIAEVKQRNVSDVYKTVYKTTRDFYSI